MSSPLEQYLDTLLAFVPRKRNSRFAGDYVSLIHVPAEGPERICTLTFGASPALTLAQYQRTVWELMDQAEQAGSLHPELDALQAQVPKDHPVFEYLDSDTLARCPSYSDGCEGMDYYLMLWQRDDDAGVAECWEPYARNAPAWTTVIGALQTLASQYEYLATSA